MKIIARDVEAELIRKKVTIIEKNILKKLLINREVNRDVLLDIIPTRLARDPENLSLKYDRLCSER